MTTSLKRSVVVLILITVFMFSESTISCAYSQTQLQTPPPYLIQQNANTTGTALPPLPTNFSSSVSTVNLPYADMSQKAVSFMGKVAMLDMTKYSQKISALNLSAISSTPNEEMVKYSLTATGSNLDVVCIFRDDILVWYKLYPITGQPLYIQSQDDALSSTNSFLNNYQNFSQTPYVATFKSMLNSAGKLQNTTNLATNIIQHISTTTSTNSIQWAYSINGVTDNFKVVSLTFQNGGLTFFQDNWNFFTIGNANVNIQKDQAIQIAEDQAQSYSYEASNNVTVSNFTFSTGPTLASLTMEDRGNGTLYPQWSLYLPLNSTYPEGITSIHILEWADTGQISFMTAVGDGGAPASQLNGQGTASVQSTSSVKASALNDAVIAAILIATTIIARYLIYKRRR